MSSDPIRRRRWATAAVFAGLALAGAGSLNTGLVPVAPAALAQSTSSPEQLRYRLDALEAELASIRARLGGAAARPATGGGVAAALSNSPVAELEGELRRLTATVEELQHQVRRIGEEAARRFSDIEFRLTELEGGDISAIQPVPPLGGTAKPQPAPTAAPAPAVQGSTGSSGVTPPAQGIVPGPSGQGTFGGVEVPLSGQATSETAAVSATEQGDLERAVTDVRQGRYDQAEERLRRFLSEYPASPLTADAWYWLGESQFVRGAHGEAARSFLSGYNTDRAGKRAPHNLYRLGVTLGRLGQVNEACMTLREVRRQFPAAPDGIVDQADAESDALACG